MRFLVPLLWLALAAPVWAGECVLAGLPAFAGHHFPLEPVVGSITIDRPFPDLANFSRPVLLTAEPLPPFQEPIDRIYVIEQRGLVRVFHNRATAELADVRTFLDIRGLVHQSGNERGLLGFAFDPDFWVNGYFYVNYTAEAARCDGPTACTRIVRYQAEGVPPAVTNGGSPTLLLEFSQPGSNHNGGTLAFGPDDMLYVGVGDGGGAGDPGNRAQNVDDILGSILRLDPHAPPDYVPSDNPFVGQAGAREEIFHYGLRNPWRISFDRITGDLWIGDVGQDDWEEVDRLSAGTPGGVNFGWRRCEGNHEFRGPCDLADPNLTFPVLEYPHGSAGGESVTGGYVYRGSRASGLYGAYLYADYVSERIWAWDQVSADSVVISAGGVPSPASFGEDQRGELYVVSLAGGLYWFSDAGAPGPGGPPPEQLSDTGLFEDVASLTPAPGLVEYDVNHALWSDRARKRRWLALPAGEEIGFAATAAWSYPVGTAFVKHFELELSRGDFRRLETRVLLLQEPGWVGYTYRWNDEQTEAFLLEGALDEDFAVSLPGLPSLQTWHYPGPTECLGCHTNAGGRVLGGRTDQLNRTFDYAAYGGAVVEQLVAWSCGGLLDAVIDDASVHQRLAALDAPAVPNHERARSHLASNCSFCHQPAAPAPGDLDLRYETAVDATNLLGVAPSEGDLGLADPLRVDPGDRGNSILWQRMASQDPAVRMAAGTRIPHDLALDVLGDWIAVDLVDPDADGLRSFEDNCPNEPNGPLSGPNDQDDSDGDLVGNVCECSYLPGEPVVSDGDFTRDLTVDTADLAVLEASFGRAVTSFDEGDANCDDIAEGADYTIWADAVP